MAWPFKELTARAEDPSLVPSMYEATHNLRNSCSLGSDIPF